MGGQCPLRCRVAAWNGRVYIGIIDGRLTAVGAATGSPVPAPQAHAG
jgi:hypothetical protein